MVVVPESFDDARGLTGRAFAFYLPMLAIGLIQGAFLTGAVATQDVLTPWNGTAVIAFLVLTLTLLLIGGPGQWLRSVMTALPFVGVIGAVTFMRLSALGPWSVAEESQFFIAIFWFLLAGPLVWLVLVTFAQAWFSYTHQSTDFYERFYHFAWATIPLILFAAVFAGLVLGVLLLWLVVFHALGMQSTVDALARGPVFLVAANLLFAAGIAILRERDYLFESLSAALQQLCRIVLVILAAFAITFAVLLPLAGPVRVTLNGSSALVFTTLCVLTVMSFNGAFDFGRRSDTPALLRISGLVSIGALPVYACLGALSVWTRVSQYGLTPERFTLFVCLVLLSVIAIVYVAAVLWDSLPFRDTDWLAGVRVANPRLALAVVTIFLLMQTTLLDPVSWSAHNQYNRVVKGSLAPEVFDYGYLRFRLGERGRYFLQRLEGLTDHPSYGVIKGRIDEARRFNSYAAYLDARLAR